MPLTRSFKDTVKARAERDPAFRAALLTEAVELMLSGDLDTGKAILRDYINATVGFECLARETGTPGEASAAARRHAVRKAVRASAR